MSKSSNSSKGKKETSDKHATSGSLEAAYSHDDLHQYVERSVWPIDGHFPRPSLAEGREDLKKPLSIYLDEQLRNSIERHANVIGVKLQVWVKHALLLVLEQEQKHFFNKKNAAKVQK